LREKAIHFAYTLTAALAEKQMLLVGLLEVFSRPAGAVRLDLVITQVIFGTFL
jgi:hypothetical protein